MVGWKNGHNGVGVSSRQLRRCKADTGGGVVSLGFYDKIGFGQDAKLFANGTVMFRDCHHQRVLGAKERKGSIHGLPQQAFLAQDLEELFGVMGPAEGPEARPPAPRHNHGIALMFHPVAFLRKSIIL